MKQNKQKNSRFMLLGIFISLFIFLWLIIKSLGGGLNLSSKIDEAKNPKRLFGISLNEYSPTKYTVEKGEAFGSVLDDLGISYRRVMRLLDISKGEFNPRMWRFGDRYWVFRKQDTSNVPHYFIYEASNTEYVIFHIQDSLYAKKVIRPTIISKRSVSGVIESSLYETLASQNVSPAIAVRLSEVYAWTIDFFRLQKGDRFEVIFEERYVDDTLFVGTGKILGARFVHFGKEFYSFYFEDKKSGIRDFYSESGEGLKRMFLKAPLEFARITSRYSKNRFHPVQKRWKAHLGTDYAAPRGTPILATASGKVISSTYNRSNGNYVKIRHNGTYTTQYLHMTRRAKGIRKGVYVEQGQVIGYVGSTGLATGPHVCYRFWKNGKQIDPLKEPLKRTEPLPKNLWKDFEVNMTPIKWKLDSLAQASSGI
ncbi:MAG: peptidoglycan DD-metalloendopeptidase family protein [Schleiferiaceae bacterium]|nr:peptidoglycan DD-metalloendopeptidase family protein [Schleiferiaceae bacterium]